MFFTSLMYVNRFWKQRIQNFFSELHFNFLKILYISLIVLQTLIRNGELIREHTDQIFEELSCNTRLLLGKG